MFLAACGSKRIAASEQETYWANKLLSEGVVLFENGDFHEAVITSDKLFLLETTHISAEGKKILNYFANYLNAQDVLNLTIHAYADGMDDVQTSVPFTAKQARTVMLYLEGRNVNTRIIHADGYGKSFPATQAQGRNAQYLNRRVEIHWQVIQK